MEKYLGRGTSGVEQGQEQAQDHPHTRLAQAGQVGGQVKHHISPHLYSILYPVPSISCLLSPVLYLLSPVPPIPCPLYLPAFLVAVLQRLDSV